MRRRSSSFVGIRRHRLLILALPLLFVVAFLLHIDLRSLLRFDLFPSLQHVSHQQHGGETVSNSRPWKIAKATMLFDPNDVYERAFDTHRRHNAMHGYGMRILDRQVTEGYWNKLLYLLTLITEELIKPVEERVDWFM